MVGPYYQDSEHKRPQDISEVDKVKKKKRSGHRILQDTSKKYMIANNRKIIKQKDTGSTRK